MAKNINSHVFRGTWILLLISSGYCSIFDENVQSGNLTILGKSNYLIGISQTGVRIGGDTQCVRELDIFLNGIQNKKVWALKMIDSFGGVPRSFIWGNNFWFSGGELCYDLNDPFKVSLSTTIERHVHPDIMNSRSPFLVEFRMVYFNFTSPLQIDMKQQHKPVLHIGLCVPQSCKEAEIIKYTKNYFYGGNFVTQEEFDIKMEILETKIPGLRWQFIFNTGVITIALIGSLLFGIIFLSELVTILRMKRYQQQKEPTEKLPIKDGNIEKFLMCFSTRQNLKKVFEVESSKNFLSVIAGIRSIVCLWVILFHVYYHSLFAIKNVPFLFSKLDALILQPVLQSCFYVDVFFVLSAFLLVYNFLSNSKQMDVVKSNTFFANLKLYFRFLVHRHLRLTPTFITTMLLSEFFYEFFDMYSPLMMTELSDLYCQDTWWYNLLYINNFLDPKDMCSSWGWYLACDMQFFIFFLFMLFVYAKNKKSAKALFIISALSFLGISYICNYIYGFTFQADIIYNTMKTLYIKPYVRINPYFGGALMGWVMYKIKSKDIKLNKVFVVLFWMLAIVVYFTTILMSYWKSAPIWATAAIMSVGKLIFGIFVGSLIVICQLGHGGYFTRIMSSKIFLFLNKFSFTMYMFAPFVITGIFALRAEGTSFNEISSTCDVMAVICITFLGSILSVLCVEIPFNRLSGNFIVKRF